MRIGFCWSGRVSPSPETGRCRLNGWAGTALLFLALGLVSSASTKLDAGPGQGQAPRPFPPQMPQGPGRPGQTGLRAPVQRPLAPLPVVPQKVQPLPTPPEEEGKPAARAPVSFRLENADLLQFISLVASQLHLNYVVDPAVKGTVNITTSGELRTEDLLPILQTVLRINGATAIQAGNFYRIALLSQAPKTPLAVYSDVTGKALPSDDRMLMQIIPLRFVSASDMGKMLTPFLSDGGTVAVHESGNILILVDDSLNVKRLMDIVAQFDGSSFARERVHLVTVHNNVASGMVPELESIFSAYALSSKNTPIRFLPLDRINAILVVAPDPSAFEEVDRWVDKLDQPAAPSGIQTFVYRVQNSEASYLAYLIGNMFGQQVTTGVGLEGGAMPGGGAGVGGQGGVGGGGGGGGGGGRFPTPIRPNGPGGADPPEAEVEANPTANAQPRTIPDLVNNTLIIQATAQQYAEIMKTLKELDVVPRQVYIEGRVYEVDLTGALSFGVNYFLQQRDNAERKPLGSFTAQNALQASVGTLVGHTRELLAFLNASENRTRVRVLSAPTVLATDNTEAKIQVGAEVPILTSQAVVGGVTVGSTNVFSNTVQNRDTGVIMTVTPRITSSGLVSLRVAQEISNAVPPPAGGIQSPSFQKRSVLTHALVHDGDTVALGGLISYNVNTTRNRVPLLGDIPGLGVLFGSTTYSRTETEIIVVLTPHVVKDVQSAHDATHDLQEGLKELRKSFRNDKALNPPSK